MKRTKKEDLSEQMKRKVSKPIKHKPKYDGDFTQVISTGSTLLDLAISGGRIHGGGIPGGILVEIFGPSGSGKTVLLSEIGGAIQRKKGQLMFHDPEARLNKQFARMFDMDPEDMNYSTPDTVPQLFQAVRDWDLKDDSAINGIMADSLAALSTDMEMGKDEGDKMGMRRAKEFSEELRRTARIIKQKNLLMVCSNQVRVNVDGGAFSEKYTSPGGESIGFYSSLRLRTSKPVKVKEEIKVKGKLIKRPIGVTTQVEVYKSSVWKPFRTAPVTILFDYGVDDIRENLQFIKTYKKTSTYTVNGVNLDQSKNKSIEIVEEEGLEQELKEEVIDLWEEIEQKFTTTRKKKKR